MVAGRLESLNSATAAALSCCMAKLPNPTNPLWQTFASTLRARTHSSFQHACLCSSCYSSNDLFIVAHHPASTTSSACSTSQRRQLRRTCSTIRRSMHNYIDVAYSPPYRLLSRQQRTRTRNCLSHTALKKKAPYSCKLVTKSGTSTTVLWAC